MAGLVSTWDASAIAQSYNFSGEITPTADLSDVYFLFAVGVCSPGGGVFTQEISSFIPANTTYSFNLSFDSIPAGFDTGDGYTIVGLYNVANGGVSLGYDSGEAAGVLAVSPAPTWNGTFLPSITPYNGDLYYQYVASESDMAAAIQNGFSSGSPLTPWGLPFPGISTDPSNPSSITLIDFSGASNGGSADVVEVVPEPGVFSVLNSGAALFSCIYFGRRPRR